MDINGDWRHCCFNDRRAGTLSLLELLTSGNFPKQCMATLQTGGIAEADMFLDGVYDENFTYPVPVD
jgi:hypothetical protein